MSKEKKSYPVSESGPRHTGKDVSSEASVRRNHPGKKETKAEHDRLVADHSIVADSLGSESFPKVSTAANSAVKAARRRA